MFSFIKKLKFILNNFDSILEKVFALEEQSKVEVETKKEIEVVHIYKLIGNTENLSATELLPFKYYYDDDWGCKGSKVFLENNKTGNFKYDKKTGIVFIVESEN